MNGTTKTLLMFKKNNRNTKSNATVLKYKHWKTTLKI